MPIRGRGWGWKCEIKYCFIKKNYKLFCFCERPCLKYQKLEVFLASSRSFSSILFAIKSSMSIASVFECVPFFRVFSKVLKYLINELSMRLARIYTDLLEFSSVTGVQSALERKSSWIRIKTQRQTNVNAFIVFYIKSKNIILQQKTFNNYTVEHSRSP